MSQPSRKTHSHERRQHERQTANLAVEVYAYCKEHHIKHESTYLRDFSDGGISFMTMHLEDYYIGQHIKFHLLDDQTMADKNTLRACGFVAWTEEGSQQESAWVGVCMSDDVSVS